MRYSIFLATAVAALTSCSYQGYRSARFTPQEARQMLNQCSRRSAPSAEKLWRLPPSMWRALDQDLSKLQSMPDWKSDHTPSEFYRQYIGITSHGRKVVYVNAASPEALEHLQSMHKSERPEQNPAANWRHMYIGACDGGTQFWGAVYDPETRRFSDLEFNFSI